MKLSVSLAEEDVAFVDDYATQTGSTSRSAVIHEAIKLLRNSELEQAYTTAWEEWEGSTDAEVWDTAASDGIADASR